MYTYDRRVRAMAKQKLTPAMINEVTDAVISRGTSVGTKIFHSENREALPSDMLQEGLEALHELAEGLDLFTRDKARLMRLVAKELRNVLRSEFAAEKALSDRKWCEHYVDHDVDLEGLTDEELHRLRYH